MAYERVERPSRPLLPGELEGRIAALAARLGGAALILLAAAGWLSLATWSAADPSLTHTTSAAVRNWLGPLGAIAADLVLQTLGFVAILAFLAPASIGLQLLADRRAMPARASFFPLALLTLAGAFSALPAPASWPLNHGLGGIVGDAVLGFGTGVLAIVNPARAHLVAGLVLFSAGMCLLSAGLGMATRDWAVLLMRDPRRGGCLQTLRQYIDGVRRRRDERRAASAAHCAPDAGWPLPGERIGGAGTTVADPGFPPQSVAGEPRSAARPARKETSGSSRAAEAAASPAAPPGTDDCGAAEADAEAETAQPASQLEQGRLPAFLSAYRRSASGASAEGSSPRPAADTALPETAADEPDSSGAARSVRDPDAVCAERGHGFEHVTERASRAMARRFAPRAAPLPEPRPAPARSGIGGVLSFRPAEPAWRRPSLNLLRRPPAARPGRELSLPVLRGSARLLEDALAAFGVDGEVRSIEPGPVVTVLEYAPARGIEAARIEALADDIARAMSVEAARVSPLPGRASVAIELPSVRRETVLLREVLDGDAWRTAEAGLPIAIGKSAGGHPIVADLARIPHLLIAGASGSGRSTAVATLILSLLLRQAPADCRLLLVDPRMLKLAPFANVPHLLAPLVTDAAAGIAALGWVVREMEERYKRMAELGVRNVEIFNNRVRNARKRGELIARTVQTGYDEATGEPRVVEERLDVEPMPAIVVVVAELADLVVVAPRDVEAAVQRLVQMARPAGIHLVLATDRPGPDIVTPAIKASLPTRMVLKLTSRLESRALLGEAGAEQLLGSGDMLFTAGPGQTLRAHGAFVSVEEIDAVVASLVGEVEPDAGLTHALEAAAGGVTAGRAGGVPLRSVAGAAGAMLDDADDELFDRAVAIVHREQRTSTSYLQRRLGLSWARAAALVERMEREGLVGPQDGNGRRHILVGSGG